MALSNITINGTTLTDNVRSVVLTNYGQLNKRSSNLTVPYRDGEWSHQPKWMGATDPILEVVLKTVPSPEENLSDIIRMLNLPALATIAATHVYAGAVQAHVEMLKSPVQSRSNPNLYRFTLRNPKGSWEAVTATTTTGSVAVPAAITTSGDVHVDDMTVRFDSTGYVEHTAADGTVSRLTLTAGATTGTVVDMGNRTVLTSTGGAQDAYFTPSQEHWLRFDANSTQALTATADHTFTWRSKWAV